jgi:hypothetical protein
MNIKEKFESLINLTKLREIRVKSLTYHKRILNKIFNFLLGFLSPIVVLPIVYVMLNTTQQTDLDLQQHCNLVMIWFFSILLSTLLLFCHEHFDYQPAISKHKMLISYFIINDYKNTYYFI